MTESLLKKLESLKNALLNDERVILLNKIEEEMNNNEEVMKLAYQKDVALTEFEDALKHFGESSKEVKDAQNRLYKSKLALDSHSLVKQYRLQYKEVQKIYISINKELFFPYTNKIGGDFYD